MSARSPRCGPNWTGSRGQRAGCCGGAEIIRQREEVQNKSEALARLDTYRSWLDLDVAEAEARAHDLDQERVRLVEGSTRLAEIAAALERNSEQAAAVVERVEALTGKLATTAQAAERARKTKQRDDELIGSSPAAELAEARSVYPALTGRLGADRPQRADDCGAAESALTADLTRRVEKVGKEIGGYFTSLAGDGRGVAAMAGVAGRPGRHRRFPRRLPGVA